MYCPKCGNEVAEGAAFCINCGAQLGSGQAGAQTQADTQIAGAAQAQALAPKKASPKVIGIAAAAVIVVVLIAGFATNWFGLAGVQPKKAVDVPAPAQSEQPSGSVAESDGQTDSSSAQTDDAQTAQAAVAVKSAVEAYTWDELSQISNEIAAAGSEDAAVDVAKKYNLCTPDGRLDGTQVKSVTLADGTQTTVQIVGFAHDDKTSGGKAGITFIFGDCIAEAPMNPSETNAGGWESSQMRVFLNSEGLDLLPNDLASVIVPVDKLTNNVGQTESVSSVSITSDRLWLFSATELCGKIDAYAQFDVGDSQYDAVLNAEGAEYKIFRDLIVDPNSSNSILVRNYDGSSMGWWERSPRPKNTELFGAVFSDGDPSYRDDADYPKGIVPGFSV
ncbi:DUF6273 domain-containing protein [Adlercreutzia mucosicola]|uniref:DUF6273 domain-containing protein n=1 Tax=Adlercreutzia mucosicola TaxID=580026 RepID=UPI000489ED67|nr:DUF6273 domain-containing protein [Adlercreutzia mucosicola]MCR2035544.1 zinc ribbon domain-containing protein [Adlercreutzia mucosicola]